MILDTLIPEFREKVDILLATLKKDHNLVMIPQEGIRSLEQQAINYRKGRSYQDIMDKISYLRKNDADYLADVLERVDHQTDKRIVTNAIPGYSWHNWGSALDCYINYPAGAQDKKGRPLLLFDSRDPIYQMHGEGLYKLYADEAIKLGLTAGYYFTILTKYGRRKFEDAFHIQLYNKEITGLMTLQQVNDHFKNKKT